MRIYIDQDFRCHLNNDGHMRAIDTAYFDGTCKDFIESYRFIPYGATWTDEIGCVLEGEMILPFRDVDQYMYQNAMVMRLYQLGIPLEPDYVATVNHPVAGFVGIDGILYEVTSAIPIGVSIIPGHNVTETTVEHYIETLKEGE